MSPTVVVDDFSRVRTGDNAVAALAGTLGEDMSSSLCAHTPATSTDVSARWRVSHQA